MISKDIELVKSFYKSLGFFAAEVEAKSTYIIKMKRLNLIFTVNKGEKYKISKINFIGDKKIKFKRLQMLLLQKNQSFGNLFQKIFI